ncbi:MULTISPECIES: glycosyltransferase [unclassified Leucobacter]|uniref:glycosyltransferase n=1 Tax=unclassified Leucobacter TaxID=2621730 RepID=UPI00165D9976|nr:MULTISPECIES: glycosyltransferase family 2 protein [unclassified Leucobacter]MBC9927518.1 glycosyltransferase family 2 protein [Leucobacter sp. cx-169]
MLAPGQDPLPPLRSAVITVSYGSGEVLRDFLKTLRAHHGAEQTVVVVDNKPDDQNVREIASDFEAIYVPLESNPGYGAGMNAGVRALKESFDSYFFCNPDVSFLEPAVGPLAHTLASSHSAGSIGPRLLNDDGSVYPSARNIPSLSTGVGHALFSKIWAGNPWTRRYQDAYNYSTLRTTGSLSGAAVMVKRGVFERIGGWDEAYFMHFEDIDLGYRIGLAGFTNLFDPTISVHHSGAHSTKKHAVVVERAMTSSAIRFMSKRYSGFWQAPVRYAIVAGLRIRGILKLKSLARDQTSA